MIDISEFTRGDPRTTVEKMRVAPSPGFNRVRDWHNPDDVERLRQRRDPCRSCGVREDRHAEAGCRRYRA